MSHRYPRLLRLFVGPDSRFYAAGAVGVVVGVSLMLVPLFITLRQRAATMPTSVGYSKTIFFTVAGQLTTTVACTVFAMPFTRRRLVRDRKAANLCVACGYDMTGNASGTCPECGVGRGAV